MYRVFKTSIVAAAESPTRIGVISGRFICFAI